MTDEPLFRVQAIFYADAKRNNVFFKQHYKWLVNATRRAQEFMLYDAAPGFVVEFVDRMTHKQLGYMRMRANGEIVQAWDLPKRNFARKEEV